MRLAGYLLRHPELVGHKLVLCEPKHRRQGGSKITLIDTLRKDTGLECVTEISGLTANVKSDKESERQGLVEKGKRNALTSLTYD